MSENYENEDGSEEEQEEFWGCRLPSPDSGWARVATCFDGSQLWEPGWDSLERVTSALFLLDNLQGHTPDWDTLLAGFQYLHVLRDPDMNWPPLHDLSDFAAIGDLFLTFRGSNESGAGSLLYIDTDQPALTASLMAECDELTRRLRNYPPLQPFIRYI
jgi:hypothetical protein